ncbi:hypothetical protein FB451DRAFT_1378068 [Mycena latifolia]|nr:hypothetical protein FB451DRAFT_1378068 [Mycena latifolia]
MTTNVAIVDERGLDYAGSWVDGGSQGEFQGTTRWSGTQGSTASFSFAGTSVSVFGSVSAVQSPQVSFTFLVDNTTQGTYSPPTGMSADLHHELFWASPALDDSQHTIVITQTQAQPDGLSVIYLDYLMWNTTSVDVPAYFIDDRDPRVVYTPAWRLFGSDLDFMHTSQGSSTTGDSLTLQFDGIAISHYAGINQGSAGDVLQAAFSIDGGPSVTFVPSPQASSNTNNNLYYSSGDLKPGKHTLVVTAQNVHTVWADYWLVKPNPASSVSVSGTSTSSSSPSAATTTPVPPKPKHTAAIAGSVVAGVVLILLLGAFFVRRRHRRKRQRQRESIDGPDDNTAPMAQVTPFLGTGSDGAGFGDSGDPFSDNIPGAGASGKWAGPGGAAPPAHFASGSTPSASGSSAFASAGSAVGASLSNPSSRALAPPSGKTARYETPPTRAAVSEDRHGEVSGEPPAYESSWGHRNVA